MFSANENLALRQQKRRITSIVESTLPEEALDMGTMVMVMQVSCRAPGCVPLETAIAVVFPRGQASELVPGLPESRSGGTYKTKVLMPMADVTRDDVLDALPPQFEGGRRTMEKLCLRARDVMLAQITQIMNEEDVEGKRLMVDYLMGCLKEYAENGCKAPEVGEPFPTREKEAKDGDTNGGDSVEGQEGATDSAAATSASAEGDDGAVSNEQNGSPKDAKISEEDSTIMPGESSVVMRGVSSKGNFVVRRPRDENSNSEQMSSNGKAEAKSMSGSATTSSQPPPSSVTPSSIVAETATDWRRRQNMNRQVNAALQMQSSSGTQTLIQRMSEREHAPGVRRPGCPCCDPDNPSNVVDSMMML